MKLVARTRTYTQRKENRLSYVSSIVFIPVCGENEKERASELAFVCIRMLCSLVTNTERRLQAKFRDTYFFFDTLYSFVRLYTLRDLCMCVCVYMRACMFECICVYVYKTRERERKSKRF